MRVTTNPRGRKTAARISSSPSSEKVMTKTLFGPCFVFARAALVVGRPAVSAAANKEQQQMMADIRMLQEQSQQLQILLGALNESLKATNARIDARIDEQNNLTRKAF